MPKTNLVEFAVEQEAAPGTAETLLQADVLVRLRTGSVPEPEYEPIDLEEMQPVSSHTPMLMGRQLLRFPASYNLRGPGDLVTAPAINDLWESAMLSAAAAKTIAIGAVTSGPYLAGETITGTNSSATGMVLRQTANGAASIPYLPLSGTLETTETLTGGTSGATSTSSAGPANGGYCYRPADNTDDSAGHHCTYHVNRSGVAWKARGALSDLAIAFRNGGPATVTQNFVGALVGVTDTALFGVTSWPEASVTPPKFLNVGLKIGAYSPTGINEVNLTWPTSPTIVEDANSASAQGVLFADYDRLSTPPTITLQVDQVAVATKDYFAELAAAGTFYVELTCGSTAGSIWTFVAPKAQFRSVGLGEVEPRRAQFPVELVLTGSNNDELLIWQH